MRRAAQLGSTPFRHRGSAARALRLFSALAVLLTTTTQALTGVAHAQTTLGYDPAADPFTLIQEARTAANLSGKHILVIAGGEWCIWCHYLNAFLEDHSDLNAAFKNTFVVVKAYIGDATDNDAFFATLPEAAGYPHFWVLNAAGEVLRSQNTLPLEDGDKSYSSAAFATFIDEWN